MARDRRGSVAVLIGLAVPVLGAAMALGIEVAGWAANNVELQGIADRAAIAGAQTYYLTGKVTPSALEAAEVAEINGGTGATTRSWNAATNTLSDNDITVQFVNGVRHAGDLAVQVTVTRPVALFFYRLVSSVSSITEGATAVAEVVSGGPACLVSLNGDINGVTTTTGTVVSGTTNVTAYNCNIRSDSSVNINGSVTINAAGLFAAGSITTKGGSATVNAPEFQNAGQIPDPFATNQTLQTALATVGTVTGPSEKITGGSVTLQPGDYSGLSISGGSTVTLSPGIYYVNGNISVDGSSTITASGVTIVTSGTTSFQGSSSSSLSAATVTNATNGAIPGVLFASSSTGTTSVGGSAGLPLSGIIYAPDGTLDYAGTALNGASDCTEAIANTLNVSGDATLAAQCAAYGMSPISSLPEQDAIQLVE